ncbi:hypothetical protein AX14_010156 [Amanita brunnescens Koide BX004]|nr:hypothetical protein AX14_010156 [Amanita brunnescens Koide BX004]
MNDWPVELISYVFELACTDAGRTVHSLSLTSKKLREIARPFLYQSLLISSLGQLTTLLKKWEKTPAHLRRIRHLFLSIDHDPHSHDTRSADASVVIGALQNVADGLRTLTLVAPCQFTGTSILSYLFRLSFPLLEELTIAGLYAYSFQTGNFPRLQRLHFAAGNRNPRGLFQFGALDKAFPELTRLRVSGLSRALPFVDELERALENGGNRQDESLALPPRLERLYVECTSTSPSPLSSRRPSRSSSTTDLALSFPVPSITDDRQRMMIERLTDLAGKYGAQSNNRASVELVVLDSTSSSGASGYGNTDQETDVAARLKQDWSDRLDGRDGPWKIKA